MTNFPLTLWSCSTACVLLTFISVITPPTAQAERKTYSKGRVTSALCPYSCRTKGIPKKHCKDWKEGNRCFVEDLTRPPSSISSIQPITTRSKEHASVRPSARKPAAPSQDEDLRGQCNGKAPYELVEPGIDVIRAKKLKNSPDGKYRLEGKIEGVCLIDAGYFEKGQLNKKIPLKTENRFLRLPFSIKVDPKKQSEIRVYNTAGERTSIPIEVENY